MIIKDRLLGTFEINHPAVVEIINSKTFQRLKGISLGGYYPAHPDVAHKVSRFEHSVGVYLLLKKFGASVEEQLSGLIHDVSHSAFSHTIDYIINAETHSQDYQESIHRDFILNCDIAPILEKHGFNPESIIDTTQFKLLEQDYPNLCADRIDNGLRGAINFPEYNKENINKIVSSLAVSNSIFVFNNIEGAELFYKLFEQGNKEFWSGYRSAIMFSMDKRLFKYAIEKNYIQYSDFYSLTDCEIIEKLKNYQSTDKTISRMFNYLNEKDCTLFCNKNNSTFEDNINCKFRRVDPLIIQDGSLCRLSDINPKVKNDFKNNTPEYLSYTVYYPA